MVPPPSESTPLLDNGPSPQAPAPASAPPASVQPASSPPAPAAPPPSSVAVSVSSTDDNSESNKEVRKIDWRRLFIFLYPYIVPKSLKHRAQMVISFLFILISKFVKLLPPLALKWAVDELAAQKPDVPGTIPLFAIAAFFLGRAGGSVLNLGRSVTYNVVSTNQTLIYSTSCFRHLQHLDVSYHVQRKSGAVSQVLNRGASSINSFINLIFYTLLPTLVEAALVFGIFVKLGTPLIAGVTLAAVVIYVTYSKIVTDTRVKIHRMLNDASEEVSNMEIDSLTNYEAVKLFGMERHEGNVYEEAQRKLADAELRFDISYSALNCGQNMIRITGTSLALLLAAKSAANGTITPGDFVMVSQYISQLFGPLAYLGSMYRSLVRSATNIEKSMDLFNTEPVVKDAEDAIDLTIADRELTAKKKGSITFDNVSFTYKTKDGRSGGIRNLSFHVPPGRMLGIVGSSGAGKSTLMRLMVRLYDPDNGRVMIDGEDVRQYTQESLRKVFGVVAQDTSLFNRTLRYNVAYGKVDASDQEVFKAIDAAQLTEFVNKLPSKLDTVVGERGVKLSGGEKQRVGVARCIIKTPVFVLLDEATSSLDSETEREMQKAIREICYGRTTVAVAHRLSTVSHADQIIVLDNGRIIERGTHKELLKLDGKYKSMWTAQTEGHKQSPK